MFLLGPAIGAIIGWVLYKFIVTGDTAIVVDDAQPVDDVREMM